MDTDAERIADDPALVSALRAAYAGSGDALDQLWWRDHPGAPGPSGAPDPSLRLRDLRERLYRADPDPTAAAEADELDRSIRADRAAVSAATAAVLARGARPAVPPPPEPAALALPPGTASAPAVAERRPLRPPVVLGSVAAVVGLVVGGLAGAAIVAQQRTAAERVQPASLAVFDRAARSTDRPPAAVLPDFIRGAQLRRLQIYSSIGTTAYGARTVDGRICLVVVVSDSGAGASCTTATAFAEGGVSAVVIAQADPVNDSGQRPQDEIDLRWLPTGFITITPVQLSGD